MMSLFAVSHNWFPVGSIQFIALAALLLVVMMVLAETRRGSIATVLLGIFLLVAHLLGDMKLHEYVWDHPLHIPFYVVGYYLLGVGWSFLRWGSHLRTESDKLVEGKEEWIKQHAGVGRWSNGQETTKPVDAEHAWLKMVHEARPRAKTSKSLILTWMSYWPLSFVWTVFNDPVKRGFELVYANIVHVFENMSVSHWSKFQAPPPPPVTVDPEQTLPVPSQERIDKLERGV